MAANTPPFWREQWRDLITSNEIWERGAICMYRGQAAHSEQEPGSAPCCCTSLELMSNWFGNWACFFIFSPLHHIEPAASHEVKRNNALPLPKSNTQRRANKHNRSDKCCANTSTTARPGAIWAQAGQNFIKAFKSVMNLRDACGTSRSFVWSSKATQNILYSSFSMWKMSRLASRRIVRGRAKAVFRGQNERTIQIGVGDMAGDAPSL